MRRALDRNAALREQRSGKVRLHADEAEGHRRLAARQGVVAHGAHRPRVHPPGIPAYSERPGAARGIEAGLRAEHADLRETPGAAQLGAPKRAPARAAPPARGARLWGEQVHR
jgi:hypothetical protein